jgi:Tfp pilus assembly protein PilF/2-polyprenyl-3-methyl-5-hydroxy-6-metoxy-1,4-benzoquinol methylase
MKSTSQTLMPSPAEINRLAGLFNAGHHAETESRARSLLELYPDSGLIWKLLSLSLHMQGKDPLPALQKTACLLPDDAGVHNNLGNALKQLGRFEDAAASYRRALKSKPDFAMAHVNLGNVLKELGQLDGAAASYRHALTVEPDFADTHNNLGTVLHDLGQLDDAEASYQRAMEIKPDNVAAFNNLANLLLNRGELMAALNLILRSLQLEEGRESRSLFVDCVKRLNFTYVEDSVRNTVIRALSEHWCRPVDLAWAGAGIVKLNPKVGGCMARVAASWPRRLAAQELYGSGGIAVVADDTLLRRILESAPVCGLEMERFLTTVRYTLLVAASDESALWDVAENVLDLYSALAQQCFINEYVFAWTDAEAMQARNLHDSLAAAMESNAQIPVLWPLAVASYFPLNTLPFAGKLLGRPWPRAVDAVLTQQIREPEVERQYRATIPRLTAIDDEVSLQVQNQYEENPYPRWIKAAPAVSTESIDDALRRNFPLSSFRSLGKNSTLDILIAGCGTGQQPIETAQRFREARLLAVDLSSTSIGYAKRKTQELGLSAIEYAQADIMKLGSLGRSFDVIESTGVLHHLADPLAGWQVLMSLLRPGGLMRLGFYSEVARRSVVLARTFIAEQGYGSSAEDIRQCRQKIMDSKIGTAFGFILKTSDFFSTSACRDLLFHVQEHQMTLAGIDVFLRKHNLQLLGFEIESNISSAYKLRFPEDPAATNLANWQIFENENPGTFIGMYQFWVQRAG